MAERQKSWDRMQKVVPEIRKKIEEEMRVALGISTKDWAITAPVPKGTS